MHGYPLFSASSSRFPDNSGVSKNCGKHIRPAGKFSLKSYLIEFQLTERFEGDSEHGKKRQHAPLGFLWAFQHQHPERRSDPVLELFRLRDCLPPLFSSSILVADSRAWLFRLRDRFHPRFLSSGRLELGWTDFHSGLVVLAMHPVDRQKFVMGTPATINLTGMPWLTPLSKPSRRTAFLLSPRETIAFPARQNIASRKIVI